MSGYLRDLCKVFGHQFGRPTRSRPERPSFSTCKRCDERVEFRTTVTPPQASPR